MTGLTMSAAHAQTTVYDNGAPPIRFLATSDARLSQDAADTFTFGNTTTFDTVQWWGGYDGNLPGVDNFTISIYPEIPFFNTYSGAPTSTFNVGNNVNRTSTGAFANGAEVYRYTATFTAPVTLDGGNYALGIVNNPTGTDSCWGWGTTGFGNYLTRRNMEGLFAPSYGGGNLAFNLQSTPAAVPAVPEPSAYAAMGMLGATLLFGMVRAQRKAIAA